MVLGFLGLKNKKPKCKKLFIRCVVTDGKLYVWYVTLVHNDNKIANNNITKVLENAFLANKILQGVSLKMSSFEVVFEEYKIFKLRNSHYSRCLSRNVKVVRLCLLNITSSDWKIHIIRGVWVEVSNLWGCVWEINQPARKLPLAVSFT